MSNLGWYQIMTTAAKAVGGPLRLAGIVIAGGAAVGTGGTLLVQKVIKAIKSRIGSDKVNYQENGKTFRVHTKGCDESGLRFKIGDEYKILGRDADAILIEIIGDDNNPYFLSYDFLREISDLN